VIAILADELGDAERWWFTRRAALASAVEPAVVRIQVATAPCFRGCFGELFLNTND
jgi:hypothetical protein